MDRTRIVPVDPPSTQYGGIVIADMIFTPDWGEPPAIDVLEVLRPRDTGVDALVQMLADVQSRYSAHGCIVEVNSLKVVRRNAAMRRLHELFQGHVLAHDTTSTSKQDEKLGFWVLAGYFEGGRIRLPYGTPEAQRSVNPLIGEALGQLPTNDLLMALWFGVYKQRWCRCLAPRPGHFRGFSEHGAMRAQYSWGTGHCSRKPPAALGHAPPLPAPF